MPQTLPPLNALRAFEAVARLESVSRAVGDVQLGRGAADAFQSSHGFEGAQSVQRRQSLGHDV
jgi:hypothetical protein